MSASKRNRLKRLNERLTTLRIYAANGQDLEAARVDAKRVTQAGNAEAYPTYTQAYKVLKTIPREVREAYNAAVYKDEHGERDKLERQRRALRSTDIPSQNKASSKSRKQAKREAKGAST